jgi:hypothetical protein
MERRQHHDSTVRVAVTEYVPDVTEGDNSFKSPTLQAGLIVSSLTPYVAAAAPVLGPVGSLISHFDIMTGIPTDTDSGSIIGGVVLDVTVMDSRGVVVSSTPVRASFGQQYSTLGTSSYGWHSHETQGTTVEDGLRAAIADIAPRLDIPAHR